MFALVKCADCGREVAVPVDGSGGARARCPLCGSEFAPEPVRAAGPVAVVARLAPTSPAQGTAAAPAPAVAAGPSPVAIRARVVGPAPIVARLAPAAPKPQAADSTAGPAVPFDPAAVQSESGAAAFAETSIQADFFPAESGEEEAIEAEFGESEAEAPAETMADVSPSADVCSQRDLMFSTDVLVEQAEGADESLGWAISQSEPIVAEVEAASPGAEEARQPLSGTGFAAREVNEPPDATGQLTVTAELPAADSDAAGVEVAEAAAAEGLAVVEVVTPSGLLEPGGAEGLTPWSEAAGHQTRAAGDSTAIVEEAPGDADPFAFMRTGRGSLGARLAPGAGGDATDSDTAIPAIRARFRQRRQQSGLRGLIGVMVSGLLGMSVVYYLFNLVGGPRYDFFKFPLPGVRHTYQHLAKYPWLPRFGIDPTGGSSNGEPAPDDT